MSQRQVDVCAARIANPKVRAEFQETLADAAALFRRAVELRRQGWALYYEATGEQPRAAKEMLR